ncbi:MAG TPA: cysteine-rich CWC family protein [Burkholderiaceae bacterium]|nr:cysteine-rich CWC family protein [Burkholderiaceae bacterium]
MSADTGGGGAAPRAASGDARCPRCGRGFHCGMHDPQPCACTTLRLSAAALAELRARYSGCLCQQCLVELAQGEVGAASQGAASDGPIDRTLDRLTAWLMPLAVAVTLLLFLQWPLRDLVHAWSTQANDLAQWLFALYVALSIRLAANHHAHLTARADLAAICDPRSPLRSRWRAVGAALCLLAWGAYLLLSGWPEVAQAVASRERFPETDNPGYFMTHVAMALLALLATWQGARDLWRTLQPQGT